MKRGYAALVLALPLVTGCVTVADFRKVQRDVVDLKRDAGRTGGEAPRERLAELAARVDALEQEAELLRGQLEVTEHRVGEALREARAARQEGATEALESGVTAPGDGAAPASEGAAGGNAMLSEELGAYKAARSTWRSNDWGGWVGRRGGVLQ
ncbi:MAG: hypothetical protein ACC649_00565, partial [Myxococcota bacterium]